MAQVPVAHKALVLKAQAVPEVLDLAVLLQAATPAAPDLEVLLQVAVPVALPGWKNLPPKLASIPSA